MKERTEFFTHLYILIFGLVLSALIIVCMTSISNNPAPPPVTIIPPALTVNYALNSFVEIQADKGAGKVLGSGFFISDKGYFVTNYHVIQNVTNIEIQLYDKKIYKNPKIIGVDKWGDIAVLKIEPFEKIVPVIFGNSDTVQVADQVYVVGNPMGISDTVTKGIVSENQNDQTRDDDRFYNYIQVDASLNPGNSGGPIFDDEWHVIGMSREIVSESGGSIGLGFAIPINYINSTIQRIIKTEKNIDHSAMGLAIEEYFSDAGDGISIPQGIEVDDIVAAEPVSKSNLVKGDIIIAINGKPVTFVNQLQQIVGNINPGDAVELTVSHETENHKLRYNEKVKFATVKIPGEPKEE